MTTCVNPDHDHTMPADLETGTTWPMTCNDCGQPAFYSEEMGGYFHADPAAPTCFLISRTDGTACRFETAGDERVEDVYEIVLDFTTDVTADVQRQLNPLGVGHEVQVEMDDQVVTTPVTFRGPLTDLMELACDHGIEPDEFEEMLRRVG